MIHSWFAPWRPRLDSTWMVIGKGPSLDDLLAVDGDTLADIRMPAVCLNHAIIPMAKSQYRGSLVAHFVDYEAFEDCAATLMPNSKDYERDNIVVVLPWEPNINLKRGGKTLEELGVKSPLIRHLEKYFRIFYYARSGSQINPPGEIEIPVRYGSAEGAINLLAASGVGHFVLVGIDGGTRYAKAMGDLKPMANGRTFDDQQVELERIKRQRKLVFSRLS